MTVHPDQWELLGDDELAEQPEPAAQLLLLNRRYLAALFAESYAWARSQLGPWLSRKDGGSNAAHVREGAARRAWVEAHC